MDYKYEMHCHDSQCSACAVSGPEEMVAACVRAGYAGMAFTNHFVGSNTAVGEALPWSEKIDCYFAAFQRAQAVAPQGFAVFFGLEHRYGCTVEELLTYGLEPDFLKAHPDMHRLPVEEYIDLVHLGGGMVIQPHPFRHLAQFGQKPLTKGIDGVEIYNAFTADDKNQMAQDFARKHGFLPSAGGDMHNADEQLGQAGLAFSYPIADSKQLVAAFKRGDGRCIIRGEIVG